MRETPVLDLSFDDLRDRLVGLGHPPYRAQQIWQAIYRDLSSAYDRMTTLPLRLRAELETLFPLHLPIPEAVQESPDGRTRKTLLRLADGEAVEAVSMRYVERRTVCVSTQVGCAMACRICATGRGGFTRNLSPGEIVGQALHAARGFQRDNQRLTNIVYMGAGEPFANYDATLASIRVLNDSRGFNLGARSFTVSTVGIAPAIERFAEEGLQVNLAVSLHAANDALRDRLLPINKTYPLEALLRACRRYIERTNRRITFEVALIGGINDSPSHAKEIVDLLGGLLCHVNLIPFNPVPGLRWKRSSKERIHALADVLDRSGIPVTIRIRRGTDIRAGCGQLRAARTDSGE
jgi:23S rRNA (adenine2503-C2)-methyltransferase